MASEARLHKKKAEDTPEGCRAMAEGDRERAAATDTERMRGRLEQSADAWTKRADLLARLEASFRARSAGAIVTAAQTEQAS